VTIMLPSGRKLWYYSPTLTDDGIKYWYVDGTTKKWTQGTTYGGHITENVTQAIARDIMALTLLRFWADKTPYRPCLTIHDEILCEVPEGQGSEEDFARLMTITPPWAAGLPLAVDRWRMKRYRKM